MKKVKKALGCSLSVEQGKLYIRRDLIEVVDYLSKDFIIVKADNEQYKVKPNEVVIFDNTELGAQDE